MRIHKGSALMVSLKDLVMPRGQALNFPPWPRKERSLVAAIAVLPLLLSPA